MKTYLITWNPNRSPEADLPGVVASLAAGKRSLGQWSCGNNKSIKRGDRVFLLRQSGDQPGIVATATVTKGWFSDEHWLPDRAAQGDKANYIRIEWEHMVLAEDRISRERLLNEKLLPKKLINIASGGVSIDEPFLTRLEQAWARHVAQKAKPSGKRELDPYGYGVNTGAAKLNVLLARGATLKELSALRKGVSSHINSLKSRPGLAVILKGGKYLLVKKSSDAADKTTASEASPIPQPFTGKLKPARTGSKFNPKEEAAIRNMLGDEHAKHAAGKAAEKIALEAERTRLRETNQPELARKVKLVSNRPALGYDIRSLEIDGRKRYIEVKNVTKGARFFLSENEWLNSRSRENYWFYLVDENAKGHSSTQQLPATELNETHLEPVQYLVSFVITH